MPRVNKHPIVGGPLDGSFANQKDFWGAYTSPTGNRAFNREKGRCADYAREYVRFNAGERGSPAPCIWLWRRLVPDGPVRFEQ